MQIVQKDRQVDTCSLQTETEEKEIKITVSSPENSKSDLESPVNEKARPKLYLDNISSPPDSGTASTSRQSEFGADSVNSKKSSLNYMLNRDPLKEFFHLTLQSIKMNSPHMNQILNINGDAFYKKAIDDGVPFNQWWTWLEDQINRIILSKIMKMNLLNKLKIGKVVESRIETKVDQMDSLEVAKMIKKMPTTTMGKSKNKLFSFNFMKKSKNKETKEAVEPKKKSEFSEILEKAPTIPKTSRNAHRKSFKFFEEDGKQK